MKLFVDEDTGLGLAKALISQGNLDVDYVANDRTIHKGTPDVDWIPYVGRCGRLVLSRNKNMLRVEAELQLLVRSTSGNCLPTKQG
ncbi:MAG: hypothetical protein ACR2GA_05620 [Chloroflexota bacterium]